MRHLGRRLAQRRRWGRALHLVSQRQRSLRLRRRLLMLLEEETSLVPRRIGRHDSHRGARSAAAGHGVDVRRRLPHHQVLLPGDLHRSGQLLRLRQLLMVEVQQLLLRLHDQLLLRVAVGGMRSDAEAAADPSRGDGHSGGVVVVLLRRRSGEGGVGGGPDVGSELLAHGSELVTGLLDPELEDGDVGHASVDGVAEARVGLVGERVDGILPLRVRELVEELGDVAGAEHPVHVGELDRVVGREVGREHAPPRALAPEELARRARRARRRGRHPPVTTAPPFL
jgi:hypothetical protein